MRTSSTEPDRLSNTARLDQRISSWSVNFINCWGYPLLRPVWVRLVLLLLIAGFCLTRAYIGLTGSQGYSHDAFMFFDGAWRMMNGQRPHIDFYSHLGPLTFIPTLAGLWLAHGTALAFGYGQALAALVLGAWAYLLARNRLGDVSTLLMSLSVTLMAVAPSALGFAPLMIAPAMIYNRQGYAVLALVLVETFAERRRDRQPNDFWGGISSGFALAVLLFLKITYFVFASFLVMAFALLRPHTSRRWAGVVIGFGVLSLLICTYLTFNLKAMIRDLMVVGLSKHFHPDLYSFDGIFIQAATLLVLGAMAALLLVLYDKREPARRVAIGSALVCLVGVLLLFGNYELTGFPLAAFLSILIIHAVTVHMPNIKGSLNMLHPFVLLLSSVFVIGFLGIQALSLPFGVAVKLIKAPRFPGLASPILKTFVPIDSDHGYATYVNQGLALLRQYRHPTETVMSLDFTNPFSFGLGIKPAPGGTTVLQYRTTFDQTHRQSAQSLFASADVVMLPQPDFFSDGTLEYSIVPIYGGYLNSHFTLIAQTKYWQLYRRNSNIR